MRLATKTRYGVRAVFDIAYQSDGQPTLAKDIARREDIPLRYLEQIFQDLKRAGVVDSKRGPKGGYYLRLPPQELRLGDVIRALQGSVEASFAEDEESGPQGPGPVSKDVTGALWRDLADRMTTWFDSITVADLVARARELGVPRGEPSEPMYYI